MKQINLPEKLERPEIHPEAWVAPGAILLGRIMVKRGASIWYNCVIRSDIDGASVEIGEDANIQDGTIIHVDEDKSCRIGSRVTVGHGTILHACTIEDDCLVGMGAILLSGSKVGCGSIIAAGALVPENVHIPPGVIAAGVPVKIRREIESNEKARVARGWQSYTALRDLHKKSNGSGK